MEENIKFIQNSIWNIYKQFLDDKKVDDFTKKCSAMVDKFIAGSLEHSFCQNLVLTYTPIVNQIKAGERAHG